MTAMARTEVVPEAARVGALSAPSRSPLSNSVFLIAGPDAENLQSVLSVGRQELYQSRISLPFMCTTPG